MLRDWSSFEEVVDHMADLLNCYSDADKRIQDLKGSLRLAGWSNDVIETMIRTAINRSQWSVVGCRVA